MKSHETAYVWNLRLTSLHIAIKLMKEILVKSYETAHYVLWNVSRLASLHIAILMKEICQK